MVIPFWEIRNDEELSRHKAFTGNGQVTSVERDERTRPADASRRLHVNKRKRSIPLVQRRNLSYIKIFPTVRGNLSLDSAVSYSFHLLRDNQRSVDSARITNDFVCPLCPFNALTVPHVWIHLSTAHHHEYSFDHKTTPDGRLHILAKPLLAQQAEPRPSKGESELLFMETCARYRNYRSCKPKMKPLDVITLRPPNHFPLPVRPYYHAETGSVISLGQWLHGTESEPLNPEWRQRWENEQVDEFTDVTIAEKEFIKLWNGFLADRVVVLPKLMPVLIEFVEKYAVTIAEADLYDELLAHLMNTFDHGHIGGDALHWLCRRYSEIIASKGAVPTAVCMLVPSRKRKSSER